MSPMFTQERRRRAALAEMEQQLRQAEGELAALREEIRRFEAEVERRLGSSLDALAQLEAQIEALNAEVRRQREERLFGERRASYMVGALRPDKPPPVYYPGTETPPEAGEPQAWPEAEPTSLKAVYRLLARRYHPDLATNEADRARRTEQMKRINQAFASGDMAALRTLAGLPAEKQAEGEQTFAGEEALSAMRRRLEQVRQQIEALHRLPSVQLSLEVKLARRRGRDLLGEMGAEIGRKIARKTAERDYLRSQLQYSVPPP